MSIPAWQPVHEFWFGTPSAQGKADREHSERWFTKDPAFDELIRQRFLSLHEGTIARKHEDFRSSPQGLVAYVVLLDQFSRNMFRGTEQMFAADAQALEAADEGIRLGYDRAVGVDERTFLYMPFMHSERLEDQERCVKLFEALRDEVDQPLRDGVSYTLNYAERHLDVVRRFGRFPHRNAVLERTSTAIELEFLLKPGSSF